MATRPSQVEGLKEIETFIIDGTRVSDAGVAELQQVLPAIKTDK